MRATILSPYKGVNSKDVEGSAFFHTSFIAVIRPRLPRLGKRIQTPPLGAHFLDESALYHLLELALDHFLAVLG